MRVLEALSRIRGKQIQIHIQNSVTRRILQGKVLNIRHEHTKIFISFSWLTERDQIDKGSEFYWIETIPTDYMFSLDEVAVQYQRGVGLIITTVPGREFFVLCKGNNVLDKREIVGQAM